MARRIQALGLFVFGLIGCGTQNPSPLLQDGVVQRETLIPQERIEVYLPDPRSPVWDFRDLSNFGIRVKLFPILSVPPSEPYPITSNFKELDLAHPAGMELSRVRSGDLGTYRLIRFNFEKSEILVFERATDRKPRKTYPLEAVKINPVNAEPTEVFWNKGVFSKEKSLEVRLTYRGVFSLLAEGKGASFPWVLVNSVYLEEYLYSVVASEIFSTWPEESLKAQAVAARTYALRQLLLARLESQNWDVDPTTRYQSYRGAKVEKPSITQAVDSVGHEVMLYGTEVIEASFSANSGGVTCSSMECFNFVAPYLQSVPDHPEVRTAPDGSGNWVGRTDPEWGKNFLRNNNVDPNLFLGFDSLLIGPSGRTWQLTVRTQDGGSYPMARTDTKRPIVRYRSAFFKMGPIQGGATQEVRGSGFGHGVGMSQWGAHFLARDGKSHREILTHYYQKIQLMKLSEYLKRK